MINLENKLIEVVETSDQIINKLNGIANDLSIHIMYDKLPEGMPGVYVERDNIKLMLINNNIKGTELEAEQIAWGLGHNYACKELGIKVNALNKENQEESNKINAIAQEYKDNLLLMTSYNAI